MKLEDIRKYWNQSGRLELDEIVHLFAHVDDLIADRDSWMQQANDRVKDWDDMRQERDALSAVVERVRNAVRENVQPGTPIRVEMVEIIREALSLTPATALRLHDAEVLERLNDSLLRMGVDKTVCLSDVLTVTRDEIARLRAGGEG